MCNHLRLKWRKPSRVTPWGTGHINSNPVEMMRGCNVKKGIVKRETTDQSVTFENTIIGNAPPSASVLTTSGCSRCSSSLALQALQMR
jgi:hypothetical protein